MSWRKIFESYLLINDGGWWVGNKLLGLPPMKKNDLRHWM